MELVSPDLSLVILTIVGLVGIALPVTAFVSLLTARTRGYKADFLWLLAIFFMPFIGSIAYFVHRRKRNLTSVNIR